VLAERCRIVQRTVAVDVFLLVPSDFLADLAATGIDPETGVVLEFGSERERSVLGSTPAGIGASMTPRGL